MSRLSLSTNLSVHKFIYDQAAAATTTPISDGNSAMTNSYHAKPYLKETRRTIRKGVSEPS